MSQPSGSRRGRISSSALGTLELALRGAGATPLKPLMGVERLVAAETAPIVESVSLKDGAWSRGLF